MASKDYYGKCGTCKHCDLGSGYTSFFSTSFKCTWHNRYVKADEKSCGKFEVAQGRSNADVAKYDR